MGELTHNRHYMTYSMFVWAFHPLKWGFADLNVILTMRYACLASCWNHSSNLIPPLNRRSGTCFYIERSNIWRVIFSPKCYFPSLFLTLLLLERSFPVSSVSKNFISLCFDHFACLYYIFYSIHLDFHLTLFILMNLSDL